MTLPTDLHTMLADNARAYRVQHRRDYISGFDWQLRLTGPVVGGYAAMRDTIGGKYLREADAHRDGQIFVETGLLPAFQTAERIEEHKARFAPAKRRKAA